MRGRTPAIPLLEPTTAALTVRTPRCEYLLRRSVRNGVVAAIEGGMSRNQAAKQFGAGIGAGREAAGREDRQR